MPAEESVASRSRRSPHQGVLLPGFARVKIEGALTVAKEDEELTHATAINVTVVVPSPTPPSVIELVKAEPTKPVPLADPKCFSPVLS